MKNFFHKYASLFGPLVVVMLLGSFPALAMGAVPALAGTGLESFAASHAMKILEIAGSVFTILQVVKKVFPFSGKAGTYIAITLNVALSALGVIVVVKPENLFSLDTLTAVISVALTAAGGHGTWRSISNGSSDAAGPSTGVTGTSTVSMLLIGAMALGCMTGCSPAEVQAYRTIVGARAFTKSIGKTHPECGTRDLSDRWQSAKNTSGVCVALDKAIAGKDVLIDLTEQYCGGPDFETGGPCNPPTTRDVRDQLTAKIKSAIAGYVQTETDIKALI